MVSSFGRGPNIPIPFSTVHEAFESIAKTHANDVAARFAGQTITYMELDAAANRLAHCLIHAGLKPKERVCLVVQRSLEMLVGIFAILKAGCQYVPIDGGVASEQTLLHIFTDSNTRFILCLPHFRDKVGQFSPKDAVIFNLTMGIGALYPATKPSVQVSPTDGVYAIYTSGSTGKPKGVDVSHGNVTNVLLSEPARLGVTVGSKVAQVLNIAFDMGAWEILVCLMNGGTLHLRGSDWTITLSEVDTLITTPSILSRYRRRSFPGIKYIASGGEFCPQILADEWAENTIFYNICGPTEVTILNTAHRHTPGLPLSIGRPIPNTTCYILDDDELPVRVGQAGTLWVGGAGVTRGYINLASLSSLRYKPDKFMGDGSRMFNTGDVVRWRDDGSLVILGRKDDQIKIKGFRVELDGITRVIEAFPGVRRATTMLIEKELHGFYETGEAFVKELALESFVQKHLPYYSVPRRWMHVGSIPLTPNGKVDRKQLRTMANTIHGPGARSCVETPSSERKNAPSGTNQEVVQRPQPAALTPFVNLEKEKVAITSQSSELSVFSTPGEIDQAKDTLPQKHSFHGLRWLRHRALILYRRFYTVVVLSNVATALFVLCTKPRRQGHVLAALATATASNLAVAVLMRSEPVINLLFTVFCSVPTYFPLAIRRHCARVFHIGGIHSGCAMAAIIWHCAFTAYGTLELTKPSQPHRISLASVALSYLVLVVLLIIGLTSYPTFRAKYHNAWEMIHRFGGWTCLILLWSLSVLTIKELNPTTDPSMAYLRAPTMWLLVVATAAIIFPWLFLRKVAVHSEVLSSHAVRIWFDYTTPVVGTSVRLAERPLLDWHGFATITNPNGKGFSLIVSRAGDFTGRMIERAPSHVYVRGIPACGVLRIATLFKSVVLVATGSGIGPCLAVILAKKVPCRILWTAPNPEQTFGVGIVDSVRATDPRAVIWNTRTQGKPDMPLLAYKLWQESGAEAVCVISNKTFTTKVVYAMESRGIPAYGAIFDS